MQAQRVREPEARFPIERREAGGCSARALEGNDLIPLKHQIAHTGMPLVLSQQRNPALLDFFFDTKGRRALL